MTEEEKKAIEDCKEFIEYLKNTGGLYYKGVSIKKITEALLNLIEKLKKENGELKENERYMKDVFGEKICTLKDDKERFKRYGIQKEEEIKELKSNSIPKDKIREIKNKNIGQYMNFYREIEELLEEG